MNRLARLREQLKQKNLQNFLITRLSNIRYLCGFTGSAGFLLLTPKKVRFFTDFRYKIQAAQQVAQAEIIIYSDDFIKEVRRRSLRIRGKMGFEAEFLDVAMYEHLVHAFPADLIWIPTSKIVESVAAKKEPDEIARIRKAISITDDVFGEILGLIKPGLRELDISAEISYLNKKYGASGDAFDPIVASGARSALPHGMASSKHIVAGDLVTIDMGCIYEGYVSDLTRTVVIGSANTKAKEIHQLVLKAQKAAIAAAQPGMKSNALDEVARKVIRDAGYEEYFGHGLGHGLGLEIHSEPRVSFISDDTLQVGHVFTVEPGIYISGFGGVRIEDDVYLTEGGCEVLTKSPRELIEL